MNSMNDGHDDSELARFEEQLDRGEPWKYPTAPGEEMDPAMPNPLVVRVTGITTGTVRGEELQFLNGVDARGKRWFRILGSKTLRDVLLDGIIKKWDDQQQAFVEVARIGPAREGERVALTFKGFSTIKSGPHKGKEIPALKVDRPDAADRPDLADAGGVDDDIPY